MPKSSIISFKLSVAGLTLSAQLINSSGQLITPPIIDGFADLGSGYYTFTYTNYPENFRGSIKITTSADTATVLHLQSIDTSMFDVATIPDFAYDYGANLNISYSDTTGKNIYAILFNAYNLNQAYNPATESFSAYTLDTQAAFVIDLSEDSNKKGYYSVTISNATNLPKVNSTNYYLIEIWQRVATAYNRVNDLNLGYLRLFWGADSAANLEIAKTVWSYETRTTTDVDETQKKILDAISAATGKTVQEIQDGNTELGSVVNQTLNLLKTCCNPQTGPVPSAQILPGTFRQSAPAIRVI